MRDYVKVPTETTTTRTAKVDPIAEMITSLEMSNEIYRKAIIEKGSTRKTLQFQKDCIDAEILRLQADIDAMVSKIATNEDLISEYKTEPAE